MLELEQAEMMPMTTPFDGYVEKPARVSSTCLVSVHRNRYSVPCEYAGQRVSTRLYPNRVSGPLQMPSSPAMIDSPSAVRSASTGSTTFRWWNVNRVHSEMARHLRTCQRL